jgi:hypothetical protein
MTSVEWIGSLWAVRAEVATASKALTPEQPVPMSRSAGNFRNIYCCDPKVSSPAGHGRTIFPKILLISPEFSRAFLPTAIWLSSLAFKHILFHQALLFSPLPNPMLPTLDSSAYALSIWSADGFLCIHIVKAVDE